MVYTGLYVFFKLFVIGFYFFLNYLLLVFLINCYWFLFFKLFVIGFYFLNYLLLVFVFLNYLLLVFIFFFEIICYRFLFFFNYLLVFILKRHNDQCKPWDPIGIANECTLINTISM